jgi:ABC-type lipoprotein export system ATPase subunit
MWLQAQRIIMLNQLAIPNYYTTLFNVFRGLLDETDSLELEYKIKDIEGWLSDDMNQLKLQEIEIRMFQNMDLLSGFVVRGEFITQFEINQKLEAIKQWLIMMLYQYLQYIRFTIPMDGLFR